MSKIIVHNPNNLPVLKISELEALQGDLKELSNANYVKLKNSIEKYGFFMPIAIWEGAILDGHQRQFVMVNEGWGDTEVPIINIDAANLNEAKEKLLQISSQYGKIIREELDEFYPEWEELGVSFDALDIDSLEGIQTGPEQSNNTGELNINDIGNISVLKLKFDGNTYLDVIDILNRMQKDLGVKTNEEVFLRLIDYVEL
jgi:hypothetical protein